MAEEMKNLCAMIPVDLQAKVREQQEASGKNLGQYMTWLITQFYENEQGGTHMMDEKKTVAFQVPADMFEQFKAYLKKHNLKQNAFFLDSKKAIGLLCVRSLNRHEYDLPLTC